MSASDIVAAINKKRHGRLFLFSIAIAIFSTGMSNAVVTLLAVDIAKTFFGEANPVAISAVSQLSTLNAAAEIIFASLLSILVIRFGRKRLFLVGIIFVTISAIGSFFAPSLLLLEFFYCLEGGGSIIISILAFASIGDSLPMEKKAKAIGYLYSASFLATLLVLLLIGFITDVGGWRLNFIFLVLPFSLAGLTLVSLVLPTKPLTEGSTNKHESLSKRFREILRNKSATACLAASILTVGGSGVAIFALAFYRTRFGVPRDWTIGVYEVAIGLYILAPLVASHLINRLGAKIIAVCSTLCSALFMMTFFFIPDFFAAAACDLIHVWFAGMATPAFVCIVLEQVPKYRDAMMSLNNIFRNVGNLIAPAVGGALLFLTSGFYGAVGIAFGGMAICGSVIMILFIRDTSQALSDANRFSNE
jgi:predicted MFS family arabinose efflux permease